MQLLYLYLQTEIIGLSKLYPGIIVGKQFGFDTLTLRYIYL